MNNASLDNNNRKLSLVVPVYNESESVSLLYQEITDVCRGLDGDYEIIFVDDGSTDSSGLVLERLAEEDSHVQVIHFRRNFGKSSALLAGFNRVSGDIVITLDADLQDDPVLIPKFIELIDSGVDLVSGWKKKRHDPIHKTLPSKFFNFVVRKASGVHLHDFNCGFKAYTAECISELKVYGGFHRFLPVFAEERGFRIGELVVQHRSRKHGASKYGVKRFYHGFIDLLTVMLITKYRMRPLHFFGKPGIVFGLTGFGMLLYLSYLWFHGAGIGSRPLLSLGVLLLLIGVLFLGIGLVGELIVHSTFTPHTVYSIRKKPEERNLASVRRLSL